MLISLRSRRVGENTSLFESDRFDVSMATSISSYPDSKLITDNLDDFAMAWGQRRSHTRIIAEGVFDEDVLSYVSVLNINRQMPSFASDFEGQILPNQARLVVDSFSFSTQNPQVLSTGFTLTNLSGIYSTLNQTLNPPEHDIPGGYSPGIIAKVSNSADTIITLTLGNDPGRPLKAGADLQELLIHVRDSANIETLPALTTVLRQSGSDVATLVQSGLEQTSQGYIFKYLWDASILPSLTLPVGLRIVGATSGVSTVEYFSLDWNASIDGVLYDSDWQDIEDGSKVVWVPNVPISGTIVITVEFSDFGYRTGLYTHVPIEEAFHAGRFIAGSSGINIPLRSSSNSGGFNIRRVGNNANSLVSSYGGQFRAIRPDMTRWQGDLTFIPQSQSRMFGELSRFVDDVGYILPALYIPNDGLTDPYAQHTDALWAIITSFEAPDLGLMYGNDTSTSTPHTEDKRFDVRMSIIEAQARLTKRSD